MTIDGMNLMYDGNNRPMKKTVVLPVTAKRAMESKYAKLPEHLRATITVVAGDADVDNENADKIIEKMEAKIAEVKAKKVAPKKAAKKAETE